MDDFTTLTPFVSDRPRQIIDQLYKAPFRYKEHQFWARQFLENVLQSNRSTHTLLNYRTDLIKFLCWYEATYQRPVNFADSESIGAYKDHLSGKPLIRAQRHQETSLWARIWSWWRPSPIVAKSTNLLSGFSIQALAVASRKRHLSAIKNFFEFLKQTHEGLPGKRGRLFQMNPVKDKLHGIKLKDVDIEHTPLLESAHWQVLDLKAVRPRERAMIHLLYYGGLRLAELTQLRWSDLHYSSQAVALVRKGGHRHILRLREPELVFKEIRRYSEHLSRLGFIPENHQALFLGRDGRGMSERGLSKVLKALMQRAGLPYELSPHSFRKACATEMYLETRDLLAVRDYLNHADAKVTQTYIDKLALEAHRNLHQ